MALFQITLNFAIKIDLAIDNFRIFLIKCIDKALLRNSFEKVIYGTYGWGWVINFWKSTVVALFVDMPMYATKEYLWESTQNYNIYNKH